MRFFRSHPLKNILYSLKIEFVNDIYVFWGVFFCILDKFRVKWWVKTYF
jgi:hypothetical protein